VDGNGNGNGYEQVGENVAADKSAMQRRGNSTSRTRPKTILLRLLGRRCLSSSSPSRRRRLRRITSTITTTTMASEAAAVVVVSAVFFVVLLAPFCSSSAVAAASAWIPTTTATTTTTTTTAFLSSGGGGGGGGNVVERNRTFRASAAGAARRTTAAATTATNGRRKRNRLGRLGRREIYDNGGTADLLPAGKPSATRTTSTSTSTALWWGRSSSSSTEAGAESSSDDDGISTGRENDDLDVEDNGIADGGNDNVVDTDADIGNESLLLLKQSELRNLRLLVVDQYDSFTYNLADLLSEVCGGTRPRVVACDSPAIRDELGLTTSAVSSSVLTPPPSYDLYDGIVLSPGPGSPDDPEARLATDIIERQFVRSSNGDGGGGNSNSSSSTVIPVLGVCLGHQIIARAFGADVRRLREPVHGQVRDVYPAANADADSLHSSSILKGVFDDNDGNVGAVRATRYHSLHVPSLNGTPLVPLAYSRDDEDGGDENVLMAFQHRSLPLYGVQFHPESVGTDRNAGRRLVENFCRICAVSKRQRQQRRQRQPPPSLRQMAEADELSGAANGATSPSVEEPKDRNPAVYIHKVVGEVQMKPEQVMETFLADCDYSFWLDDPEPDPIAAPTNSRRPALSILGTASKEHGRLVEYFYSPGDGDAGPVRQLRVYGGSGKCTVHDGTDILTYLRQHHDTPTDRVTMVSFDDGGGGGEHSNAVLQQYSEEQAHSRIPFDYRGGNVGYLGYEVRHDTARYLKELEGGRLPPERPFNSVDAKNLETAGDSSVPTSAFIWADRSFVYDHKSGQWYLVGIASEEEGTRAVLLWMRKTAKAMMRLDNANGVRRSLRLGTKKHEAPSFVPNRSRETYNRNFDQCLEYIREGESYELCVTNQLEAKGVRVPGSRPLDFYSLLRKRNPAPFSAFFNWNSNKSTRMTGETPTANGSFAICCSSPERFVSVSRKQSSSGVQQLEVEAKPIKGTCARVLPADGRVARSPKEMIRDRLRAKALEVSVKNRAENLMIVDLLRNDLNRVCETGSVHVSNLMAIESFATVHQMVSTIRGTLSANVSSPVDVLKACFPGGSMTGAPKLRTMELLDEIEESVPRGPYSGSLGYISVNGCMDMNIVIRTAILKQSRAGRNGSIGNVDRWDITIGAGGAITALSESEDEYEEMLLKASAVIGAVNGWVGVPVQDSVECEESLRVATPPASTNTTAASVVSKS